jgi:hypothetical protein
VSGRKFCGYIRGGKFDKNLFSSRVRSVSQAQRWINAIYSFAVVDVWEKDSWYGFGREKESKMYPILEGKGEEGMGLKLQKHMRQTLQETIGGTEKVAIPF